jgi:ferrochelatase
MSYGTPRSPTEIEPYYTHIRRGRRASPELLAELQARYEAIGGTSPLAERSEAQAARLEEALDQLDPGRYRVQLGFKHTAPFVEDALDELASAGVERVVGLVLAPHYSSMGVGEYLSRLRSQAARRGGLPVACIESWYLEPAYVDFLARAVVEALARLPRQTKVLFSAHSLPLRVLASGDPYPAQLRATAEAVAQRCGLDPGAGWSIAWQSAGRTPEPWAGPDVGEVVRDLADHHRRAGWDGTPGERGVLICPCGFTADHLEVLYDLDIEVSRLAGKLGLAFARTRVLNDDPAVLGALAARVAAAAAGG